MVKLSLLVFALTAFFATNVNTANYSVEVGGDNDQTFTPAAFDANVGDNVIFIWKSGQHNVIQSDEPKTCTKSAKADAFFSEDYSADLKTPQQYTVNLAKVGKVFYFCSLFEHCAKSGMEGEINVLDVGTTPKVTGVPAEDAPATATSSAVDTASSSGAAPESSNTGGAKSVANNEKPLSAAVVGGALLSLVGYML